MPVFKIKSGVLGGSMENLREKIKDFRQYIFVQSVNLFILDIT